MDRSYGYFLSAYWPDSERSAEERKAFWREVDEYMRSCGANVNVVLLGDLNVKVRHHYTRALEQGESNDMELKEILRVERENKMREELRTTSYYNKHARYMGKGTFLTLSQPDETFLIGT